MKGGYNMVRLIAMHEAQRPNRGQVFQKTLEDYDALIREQWLRDLVERIRKGDDEAKKELPFRCPHYTEFKDNKRQQKSIIPEAFTFQTCIDIDDASYVEGAIKAAKELNGKDGIWKRMLLHMDYSARKKLHIDVRMPIGMTIEETQRAYCEAIGVPFDESCITPERFIYITDEDSEIYRSEHWYEVLPEKELKVRHEAFAKRGLSIDGKATGRRLQVGNGGKPNDGIRKMDDGRCSLSDISQFPNSVRLPVAFQTTYKGIPFSEIIDEYWRRTGGIPVDGERNVRLHKLAVNLRAICENEPARLLEVIPKLGLSESEVRSVVESACKEKPKGFTSVMKQIVDDLQEPPLSTERTEGEAPPELPKKLPKLIHLLLSKEPSVYHPTVANAVFPSLGAHFVGVNFPYVDNTLREATFMCCTMAPMSSGKSCVDRLVDRILADIRQRDQLSIDRENEWKQQCKTRGANKEKPKRPEGLCVQILDSDMTNAAFVQKLVDADGKFLFTIVDEVELFYQLKTSGNKSVGKLFRLAFDNKPYGQVRVGIDSVSGSMPLRWNWNAATTIQRGQAFFRQMKADGTLSRINFTTILTERGQDIPVHGIYDEAFDAALKPYIDRLNAASGTIDCPQAKLLVKQMLEENRHLADTSDDELYERLSYRAVVIAWLKAMTLYVAEGQWSKQIEDFAVWSMHYDMWCKMNFFGEEMREQMAGEVIRMKPGPQNLLGELPDEFTKEDAERMRAQHGKERNAVKMLYMWRQRGYITLNPDTLIYKKVKNK